MVFMLWIILLSEKGTKKNNDSSTITKRFENRDSILLEDRFMLMYICGKLYFRVPDRMSRLRAVSRFLQI